MTRARTTGATHHARRLIAAAALAGCMATAGPAAAAAAQEAAVTPPPAPPAAPCRSSQLVANSAESVGATGWRFTFLNEGPEACTLKGYPTLAVAGQGSPDRNKPLTVRRQGTPRTVKLQVGGMTATTVTFVPVLGEADGYCASGADPTVAPSMVVGVAGGRFQVGLDDGGNFALCGSAVRATAFRPA